MPNTITASQSYYQKQLAMDAKFVEKVQQHIINYALTVMSEALNTTHHATRLTLARSILGGNSDQFARIISMVVVNHANVNASISIIDGNVISSVTDGLLLAAIGAQWNVYAGIESGV